jgi:serine protease Do
VDEAYLDDPANNSDTQMVVKPPHYYIPASDIMQSISDPPSADNPVKMSWLGIPQMKGLEKAVAEVFKLQNQPAVQVGDVAKNSPADKAGIKVSDIIVSMDGKPLERGDEPEELPMILNRKVQRMKPGSTVTFGIIHQMGDPPKDVTVTLEVRPKQPAEAKRFYAKDLGFVVRDKVFVDTYRRKLPEETSGVIVAVLRPQGAAEAATLSDNDFITQMNGKPVTDLDQFKKDYQQFRTDKPKDAIVLAVTRTDGKEETINIEPPQTGTVPGGGF